MNPHSARRFGDSDIIRFFARNGFGLALVILTAALIVYHVFTIWRFGTALVGGQRYFLLNDDAMISMRYACNLSEGNGLVYSTGVQVEGFSNPAQVLLATCLHLLPITHRMVSLAMQLLDLCFSLGVLGLVMFFWGGGARQRLAGGIAGLLYVGLSYHLFGAHTGLEAYLMSLTLLAAIPIIDKPKPWRAGILGILPLVHISGIDLYVVICALVLCGTGTDLRL